MVQARRFKRAHYLAYLNSAAWKRKRQEKLDSQRSCQRCPSVRGLEVHHRTYVRFGNERLADLEVLCHDCHEAERRRKLARARRGRRGRPAQLAVVYRADPAVLRATGTEAAIAAAPPARLKIVGPSRPPSPPKK